MTDLPRFSAPPDPRPLDEPWPALRWPPDPGTTLAGRSVELRPVRARDDAPALFAALDDDRVWTHLRGRPADAAQWVTTITQRYADGTWPWLVTAAPGSEYGPAGTVLGTSSYLEVSPVDARLEIGSTSYAPAVWASRVNPETKLLLLRFAFTELGAGRVQLKTDIRNTRSAAAIARLGATYEGTLRRYQRRADDTVRDTVLFSITVEQWPDVERRLTARLGE